MIYRILLVLIALGFTAAFAVIVAPPFMQTWDIMAALRASFVNPYAAGFSLDTILCWCVLVVWIVHEARTARVKHGWIAALLGVVPGVAVGFALYLLLREPQLSRLSRGA